jgi:hypothetical protein
MQNNPPVGNNPPSLPRLGPQENPVPLPNDGFMLPQTLDDASTTASGLSSLESYPESSRETSPATSPRGTNEQDNKSKTTPGRQ